MAFIIELIRREKAEGSVTVWSKFLEKRFYGRVREDCLSRVRSRARTRARVARVRVRANINKKLVFPRSEEDESVWWIISTCSCPQTQQVNRTESMSVDLAWERDRL